MLDDDIQNVFERAAIIEFDGCYPRSEAQDMAAQQHGFVDWADFISRGNTSDKIPR